jgi:hypothetical protein
MLHCVLGTQYCRGSVSIELAGGKLSAIGLSTRLKC